MSQRTRACLALAVALGLLAGVPAAASARVVIRKIGFDPTGSDTGTNRHLNKEWILIKNTGPRAVQLRGWRLHDKGRDHVYRFSSLYFAPGDRVAALVVSLRARAGDPLRGVYSELTRVLAVLEVAFMTITGITIIATRAY